MPTVQTLFPLYSELLTIVTNNEPIDNMDKLIYDQPTVKHLYTTSNDPVNNYLRRHILSLMACKYWQHKNLKAATVAETALGVAAEADFIDQFGCPTHNPETALLALDILQHMPSADREQSNLTVLGGHMAAARTYMNEEIARKGPWTHYDARMMAWLAAVYQERANSFTLSPTEYPEIAKRIEQLGFPLLQEVFLHNQFEASLLESTPNPTYIDATIHAYGKFLLKKNAHTSSNAEYLKALSIAADHGHLQSALLLGKETLNKAFNAEESQRAPLFAYAEQYLNKARSQYQDPVLADAAAFELAKIPAVGDDKGAQIIEQFNKLLNRFGKDHSLTPRVHAHLALHYKKLMAPHLAQDTPYAKSLVAKYRPLLKEHTQKALNSKDPVAHNLLACKEMFDKIGSGKLLTAADIAKLNNMIAHSRVQTAETSDSALFNPDQICVDFDHTIGFEDHKHAASVLALRAFIALTQEKNSHLFEQYILPAYTLDPEHQFIQVTLNGYMDGLCDKVELDRVENKDELEHLEKLLNELDKRCHLPVNVYFHAKLEELRDNPERAIELYQALNMAKGWYSAGKVYDLMLDDLDAARRCFDKAAELEPIDVYKSAQAGIAGDQERYQDEYELLLQTHKTIAKDGFALAQLVISGRVKEPDYREIYNYLRYAYNLNKLAPIEDPATAAFWDNLATCVRLHIDPASDEEIKTLKDLGKAGIAEAYRALAAQEAHKSKKTTDIQRKKLHEVVEKNYLELALKMSPTCNRTKLQLAKVVMPAATWQRLDLAQASEEQCKNLMRARALYQEIIASEEPSCFVATAHALYGDLLACVYKDYKRSEKMLRKGIALGSSTAYLALLKSYLVQEKHNELEKLLQEYGSFEWQFVNNESRTQFEKAQQTYINLLKKHQESCSTAASSSV
jgi:hypothetical protein